MTFMQQTTSPLSEGDSSVCNQYLMQYTYLTNSPKVKGSANSVISDTNTSWQTFTPFTGASFIDVCLLQPMLHVNHSVHEDVLYASVRGQHGFSSKQCCIVF